ncbi:MAG TPA: Hsp70 family protein [Deltaproteobacteria bacterium]|nr:Hsp70 family protein [Deltaproteobacteria bacterium]
MSDDSQIVLGIDLGTTFSAMALVNNHGKPEIVPNGEGFATTPSVVHFYGSNVCVVGEEAVKMVVIDPENVVRFIKRHMGEEDFTLEFFGHSYTPQEISALILRKLKEDAEELLGRPVVDAVITVPAYFHSAQRGATAEAGTIAGLNVLSIINEPTAAAIAYGLDRIGGQRKLLVLDLGGGTFDVTVMEIRGTKLSTIASDGNAELGGKDWDDRLLNYVAEQFFEKYQLDPRDDAAPYQELYERCLHAKICLSTKERAVVPVNYRGKRLAVKVTRDLFEQITADLVQQCEDTSNIVLEKAGLTWDQLDDVLLVGGSTRMPMIRRMLTNLSGREPAEDVNPEECVALGASLAGVFRHRPDHPALREKRRAMVDRAKELRKPRPKPPVEPRPSPRGAVIGLAYGGHVAQDAVGDGATGGLPDVTIEDATTHPLGIIVLNKSRQERVFELIPEGTKLPHEIKHQFAYAFENMTAVRIEVTEGSGSFRDEVTVIGQVELTGLPPRPRGTRIDVVYSYGVNQILKVQVIDVETGGREGIDIRFQGGMTAEEVALARGRTSRMVVD